MSQTNTQPLKNALVEYFSASEIRSLCFDLGIPYEDLEGGGKTAKIESLIAYAKGRRTLDAVVNYVNRERPFLNLEVPAAGPTGSQTAASHSASQDTPKIIVQGDYIAGDKTAGDKVEGDKISTGNISGNNIAIGRGATATSQTSSGDTYNFSGNFSGAILAVNATLENVNLTIGALPWANDETKAELEHLVTQLQEQLQQIPPEKKEDAEAVAALTETLLDTANQEKPNKQLLQITGEGLKQAAKNLAAITPDVVKIAGAIVTAVLAL